MTVSSIRNALWHGVVFSIVIGSKSFAQGGSTLATCSAHFQARADWLRSLDANAAAVAFFEIRAETLWDSIPRDCGMQTGFGNTYFAYSARRPVVTDLMVTWAEDGDQKRPTCMEVSLCTQCLATYRAMVR